MERRGRIPIAKFRTQEGKTRSRSRVREPDYNEQDPETDLFTLLEDNIALKEANKSLKTQLDESNVKQKLLQEESNKITKQLEQFKQQHEKLEKELMDVTTELNEMKKEKSDLDRVHKLNKDGSDLQQSSASSTVGFIACPKLQSKLLQILCAQAKDAKRVGIDLVDEDEALNNATLTIDLIEQLIDEFLTLKTNINAVELQLYEANEKMSDLLENQQHLDHENEVLRTENINLTKVAKLLTDNMKESVETSKKMEAALIKLKQRNDELMGKSRDRIDGPSNNNGNTVSPTTTMTTISATTASTMDINVQKANNNNSVQIEKQNQNRDHGERVVEMQNVAEAFAQTETATSLSEPNEVEELKSLKLKLQILEAKLREVTARAQLAESELEKYKLHDKEIQLINSRDSLNITTQSDSMQTLISVPSLVPPPPPRPPPPPPPMPNGLLYKAYPLRLVGTKQNDKDQDAITSLTGNFDFNTKCSMTTINPEAASVLVTATATAGGSSNSNSKNLRKSINIKMKPEAATGVDALVSELKSGRVTLRRNRRKTRTNEALQEMFQILEISQQQNRNSKICINLNS